MKPLYDLTVIDKPEEDILDGYSGRWKVLYFKKNGGSFYSYQTFTTEVAAIEDGKDTLYGDWDVVTSPDGTFELPISEISHFVAMPIGDT